MTEGRQSAARARNAGWRAATGEVIFFLDADTIVHPDFLSGLCPVRGTARGRCLGAPSKIRPTQSIYTRVLDLDWIWPAGESDYCGGDALMRRSILEQTAVLTTLIAGEEPELCRRLRAAGHRILHLDVPMTGHDLGVKRWGQYWNRSVRTGHAYAEIAGRFAHTSDPLWLAESRRNLVRAAFCC